MRIFAFFLFLSLVAILNAQDDLPDDFPWEEIEIINNDNKDTVVNNDDEDEKKDNIASEADGNEDFQQFFKNIQAEINNNTKKKTQKFNGHWTGIEIGMSNYLSAHNSLRLDNKIAFMKLNPMRSYGVNLNIAEQSIGLYKDRAGIVTGLGLEFSNYHFDDTLTIRKTESDFIFLQSLESFAYKRSKFSTVFITLPILLEYQFGKDRKPSKRGFISAGVAGGMLINAYTRQVYKETCYKEKIKRHGDYDLRSLRYGFTARAGYGNTSIFGTYYAMPLFLNVENPQLYPFMLGLSFSF